MRGAPCGHLLVVDGGFLAAFLLGYVVQHLPKGYIITGGVHGNVAQTGHLVGGKSWLTTVGGINSLHDQIHLTTTYQLIQSGFPQSIILFPLFTLKFCFVMMFID